MHSRGDISQRRFYGAPMGSLRAFFRDHRQLAAMLVALALAMKALLPAGYMIGSQPQGITIAVCTDATGKHDTRQIVIPQTGKPAGGAEGHGKGDGACPYSALGMASISGADATLLAIVLALILALGFAPAPALRLKRASYLLPPLRGPPSLT